ncbi:MAG TPA: hypothetical protein VHA33_10915 [Candidatus Angelobacter sp.]|nr:hypothetical protein [Candidatus Angelobacter sp.]
MEVAAPSDLKMRVAKEDSDPTLWLSVTGEASGRDAVLVLLPEHVTVRKHGSNEAQHLYLWQAGHDGSRPSWLRRGHALQYEVELASGIHFLARASLQPDGVLLHYEFVNNSGADFDSVQAVTDPRMVSPLLHDARLERTYVHEEGRFVLLASDMPERITMPIHQWLPNRYRISYSWPVERTFTQRQPGGITFFNARRRVDEPFLATVSSDGQWIMATFSRNPGNLWTNPDLTCQHADPDIPLQRHSKGVAEERILLIRGSLQDVLRKVVEEKDGLELSQ